MVQAVDVAKYVTEQCGGLSGMKLQKLVYYAHAWTLVVTEGEPLVDEPIEAWRHGPVIRDLWEDHRGMRMVSASTFAHGDADHLAEWQREVVDAVLAHYRSLTAAQLRALTHVERPWLRASGGFISDSEMLEYYTEKIGTPEAVALPAWAGIFVSEDEYDQISQDLGVPDDISSLVDLVQSARAELT